MEIAFVLLLIIANGVLALSEIAVVSSRKERLAQWAARGNRRARTAYELAQNPTRFLSSVQVGITLVSILAGAFGGARIADNIAEALRDMPVVGPHSDTIGIIIVVMTITYLSVLLGELVPKRLALHNPERTACWIAAPMRVLARVATPLVWLLTISTNLALGIIRLKPRTDPSVTEDEIRAMIRQGANEGVLEKEERNIVDRVLSLDVRRVSALMTPRHDIIWLDETDSFDDLREKVQTHRVSRLPLRKPPGDHVLGVVHMKDALLHAPDRSTIAWRDIARQPLYVPETTRALKLLEMFKSTGIHFAVIIDEYGSLQGIATLNDILEAIVGDVESNTEEDEPTVISRGEGAWLIDASLPLDTLHEKLGVDRFALEEQATYHTLAGLVVASLARIPKEGDQVEIEGFRFEVIDMDGRRIDKLLVSRIESSPGKEEP